MSQLIETSSKLLALCSKSKTNLIISSLNVYRRDQCRATFCPILGTVVVLNFRMDFKAFCDSACISSVASKHWLRCDLLNLGNIQKSHWVKLGEYGGCETIWVKFLTKRPRRTDTEIECFSTQRDLTRFRHKLSFKMLVTDAFELPIASLEAWKRSLADYWSLWERYTAFFLQIGLMEKHWKLECGPCLITFRLKWESFASSPDNFSHFMVKNKM